MKKSKLMNFMIRAPQVGMAAATAVGDVALAGGVVVGVTTAAAVTGGAVGGVIRHKAADGAQTVQEAAVRASKAVIDKRNATISHIN